MTLKVLIIKTSALGDIVQTFSALDALLSLHPDAQVDWVVEKAYAPLLNAHPKVRRALAIDSKKWRCYFWRSDCREEMRAFSASLDSYDVAFDMQGNLKSACILSFVQAKDKVGFGWKTAPEWPSCFFTTQRFNPPPGGSIRSDYRFFISAYFKQEIPLLPDAIDLHGHCPLPPSSKKRFLVCPGAKWGNKQLSEETLKQFLKKVQKATDCQYLFSYGSEMEEKSVRLLEAAFAGSISYAYLSFPDLQSLMAQADLVIAMDSFPLHLAATTLTPTYSVFGPSSGQKYAPEGPHHFYLQAGCPYQKTFIKRCKEIRSCQTGLCLKGLESQQLFNHFIACWQGYCQEKLANPSPSSP
ncbi:MAG: waaC [Chlamydiales bacterium]|jgi:heptosyltransferase-1|nr:waaC [Chlamydiales bacterium]